MGIELRGVPLQIPRPAARKRGLRMFARCAGLAIQKRTWSAGDERRGRPYPMFSPTSQPARARDVLDGAQPGDEVDATRAGSARSSGCAPSSARARSRPRGGAGSRSAARARACAARGSSGRAARYAPPAREATWSRTVRRRRPRSASPSLPRAAATPGEATAIERAQASAPSQSGVRSTHTSGQRFADFRQRRSNGAEFLSGEPTRTARVRPMSDLTRSGGGPPSRRSREQRAYRLVVVGGDAGVVAVVGLVLAVVGVIGFGIPVIAAIVAVVCFLLDAPTRPARTLDELVRAPGRRARCGAGTCSRSTATGSGRCRSRPRTSSCSPCARRCRRAPARSSRSKLAAASRPHLDRARTRALELAQRRDHVLRRRPRSCR